MYSRGARAVRGLTAGSAATVFAAGSHGMAGGHFASATGIVLAIAFSSLLGIALSGRSLSLIKLSVTVVFSQLGFHLVFSTIGASGATAMTVGGHHNSSVLFSAGSSMGSMHADPAMWLAHAVAATVTILVLRRGGAAFWGMRAIAAMLFTPLFRARQLVITTPQLAAHRPPQTRRIAPTVVAQFLTFIDSRGPPVVTRGA
jgi:hypothetical protein